MEHAGRPIRRRRRPMSSCEQCRRRKVKCDQKSPCDQCVRSKCESCVYHRYHPSVEESKSPPDEGLYTSQVREFLSSNGIEQQNPAFSLPQTPKSPSSTIGRRAAAEATSTVASRDGTSYESRGVKELKDKIGRLEKELSIARTAEVAPEKQFYANVADLKGVVSKTRLMGRSHFMYIIKQGYISIVDFYRALDSEHSEYNLLAGIGKCKKLGKSIKEKNQWHQYISPDLTSYVPARETCDMLVQVYFRTFESVHRILHIPSFSEEYDRYWNAPEKASSPFMIKFLLVIAIGASFQYGKDSCDELRESAKKWIHVAHTWVNFPFTEKHIVGLGGVQIHCLLLIARQILEVGGDMTWLAAGNLVRVALLIGLHRDPSKFPGMSEYHSEMRRRLWATVTEICFQSAMSSGGMPLVDLQDSDCLPPRNLNDDQIGEGLKGVPIPRDDNEMTQTTVQRLFAQTLPIRLRIASALNNTITELSYTKTNEMGMELSQLYQGQLKRLNAFKGDLTPTKFQLRMLKLVNVGTLGILHMPFAVQARKDPSYFFSRKTCLDFALAILAPDNHSKEGVSPTQQESLRETRCLEIVGGGYFRSLTTIAALMVYGELTFPDGSMEIFTSAAESIVRKEMRRAIDNFSELTLKRVKAGERNIKGHLFAGAIRAQINARENDLSVENETVKALKECLDSCLAILEAKAGTTQTPGSETTAIGSEQMYFDGFASDMIPEPFWWDDLDFDFQDTAFARAWNVL